MSFIRNFPFFCIILSMFGGILCAVLKKKAARNACLIIIFLIAVMSGFVLMYTISTGEHYVYWMGHFPAPWGNEIRVGILEGLLALVFSIVMLLSLMGGMVHIFEEVEGSKINYYFVMICLLLSSLLAMIYTNDLFTGYVFVEINTLTSCAIVMLKDSEETLYQLPDIL